MCTLVCLGYFVLFWFSLKALEFLEHSASLSSKARLYGKEWVMYKLHTASAGG